MRLSSSNAAQIPAQRTRRQAIGTWLALALFTAGLAAAVVLFATGEAEAAPETVYDNDFATAAGPEWSNQKTEESPSGQRFLGRFVQGDSPVSLNLTNLVGHNALTVEFDFYILGSMDGNLGSTELFSFTADGTTLRTTTFSNTNNPQAYPDDYPGGDHEPQTGAIDEDSLEFAHAQGDSTYRLKFEVPHSASSFSFAVVTTGLDHDLEDESWGLDNISVSAEPLPPAPPAPPLAPAAPSAGRVGPPVPPDFVTALFDGNTLFVRLKCPARFKPQCLGTAAAFTSKARCTRGHGRRRCKATKPITASASAKQKPNKWKVFALKVKKRYRSVVARMAKKPNKKLLYVRQLIHAKRFKHGRRRAIFHVYRVRTAPK